MRRIPGRVLVEGWSNNGGSRIGSGGWIRSRTAVRSVGTVPIFGCDGMDMGKWVEWVSSMKVKCLPGAGKRRRRGGALVSRSWFTGVWREEKAGAGSRDGDGSGRWCGRWIGR